MSKSDTGDKKNVPTNVAQSSTNLSIDSLFDVLSNERRRVVISYLANYADEDRTITLDELTAEVATAENGKDAENLSSQERKRVYVSLYQTHMPKLAEVGVVKPINGVGQTATDFELGEDAELYSDILIETSDVIENGGRIKRLEDADDSSGGLISSTLSRLGVSI